MKKLFISLLLVICAIIAKAQYNNNAAQVRESTEKKSGDLFSTQNKNAIKLNCWSIIFGTTSISYERALKPGRTIEFDVGIVGLGFDIAAQEPQGIGVKAGYKFILNPDFFPGKNRFPHILDGLYIKPELALASYNLRYKGSVFKGAFFTTLGEQLVILDVFLIDLFVSIGLGFTDAGSFSYFPYYFGIVGDGVPVAGSLGIRLGFLF